MSSHRSNNWAYLPPSLSMPVVQGEQRYEGSQSQSSDSFAGTSSTPQYWYPPYSYRYHVLRTEREEIFEQCAAAEKQHFDGLINAQQLLVLEDHFTALLNAKSKEIQDEENKGPVSREEILKGWGYTPQQAREAAQQERQEWARLQF
ncbi:hypothetical protein DENSPDRAFT_522583 [Dentipellis sp. KUC8613]|nr:hypothetical protein DENSPDRAFT_522583 [Dentipellis sp. KUC8613]